MISPSDNSLSRVRSLRRAALLVSLAAGLGWTIPNAQAQALTPLPQTSISTSANVASVSSDVVELLAGWQQGLAIGNVLDLRNASGEVIGRIRLVEVTATRSRGQILSAGDMSAAKIAVAPMSLAITRISGKTINFSLPRDNRVLNAGDILTIVRGGQPIGHARFEGYNPISATLLDISPGITLANTDVLWAYNETATLTAPTVEIPSTTATATATETTSTQVRPLETRPDDAFNKVSEESVKEAPKARENKSIDYALAALAAAYVLTADPKQNSKRPERDTFLQFSTVTALPGGGFGITPEGVVEPGGAMQVNIPVAYNPRKTTLLIGGYAAQNVQGDSITSDIGRNGTALLGGGGKIGGRGVWLSRMIISTSGFPFGDSAYNLSVELAGETEKRPAIAFGFQDIKGTYKRSPFVVATKRMGSEKPLYLTLGAGAGRFQHSRIFGGISYTPTRKLSLAAEYDGLQFNIGTTFAIGNRLTLLASLNDLTRKNPAIQKQRIIGRRYQIGATYRIF